MLRIRLHSTEAWNTISADELSEGYEEYLRYQISIDQGSRLIIDDLELLSKGGIFEWQPGFYAGHVTVEVIAVCGTVKTCRLQVDAKAQKSTVEVFNEMIGALRTFDPALLLGECASTLGFGNGAQKTLLADTILLARLRQYAKAFLTAAERALYEPHQRLSASRQPVPLAQIRRLPTDALRDRRLVSLLNGSGPTHDTDLLIHGISSRHTCDTPANRTLRALLKRFSVTCANLAIKVRSHSLAGSKEDQAARSERRLELLDGFFSLSQSLLQGPTLSQVSDSGASASGLTQIAAHPRYQKAYRLGCAALMTGVAGDNPADRLHSQPTWGIFETWCYIEVLAIIARLTGAEPTPISKPVPHAQLAYLFLLPDASTLEVLFQARFRSIAKLNKPFARSLSRERYPDILLVQKHSLKTRSMILDAKWRSGRSNVLEAMESAHIYHDSLRVDGNIPNPCLLLLPGRACITALETEEYLRENAVGAISEFSKGGIGVERLTTHIQHWLDS